MKTPPSDNISNDPDTPSFVTKTAEPELRLEAVHFHPKNWGVWFLLFLTGIYAFLPGKIRHRIGNFLFSILVVGHRRREVEQIIELNLRKCLGDEYTPKLKQDAINELKETFLENFVFVWRSKKYLNKIMTFDNPEVITEATDKGRGVILIIVHSNDVYIVGAGLACIAPSSVTMRPLRNPVLNWAFMRAFEKLDCLPKARQSTMRQISALKQGRTLYILPDIDLGPRVTGVYAPFFGQTARTIKTPGRLAQITNAKMVLVSSARSGSKYSISLKEIDEVAEAKDPVESATRLNKALEKSIRQNLTRWFWAHKRFKTQPDGTDIYAHITEKK